MCFRCLILGLVGKMLNNLVSGSGDMLTVERYRNKFGFVWINVASSIYTLENFLNLDNSPFLWVSRFPAFLDFAIPKRYVAQVNEYRKAASVGWLIRHDCREPIDFPEASVDHILCSHFLEHVYPNECENLLRAYFRMLKKNGTLHVIVPDFAAQIRDYVVRSSSGDPDAADRLLNETLLTTAHRGSLKYRVLEAIGAFGLQHRWMYDRTSIANRLTRAGFDIVDVNDTPSRSFRSGDDSVHVVGRKN
jgi:predicted SAM-dependent methyltransferase